MIKYHTIPCHPETPHCRIERCDPQLPPSLIFEPYGYSPFIESSEAFWPIDDTPKITSKTSPTMPGNWTEDKQVAQVLGARLTEGAAIFLHWEDVFLEEHILSVQFTKQS